MELTASRYNIQIPLLDGGALLYNTAHQNFQRVTADELKCLGLVEAGKTGDATPELIDELVKNGFAIPSSIDELAHLRKQYEMHRFDYNSMTMTLASTTRPGLAPRCVSRASHRSGAGSRTTASAATSTSGASRILRQSTVASRRRPSSMRVRTATA